MQQVQQDAVESVSHRQALVESMARDNAIAAEELRLLLGMERQALPRQRRRDDR